MCGIVRWLICILLVLVARPCLAQRPAPAPAPAVDEDFYVQGEYFGYAGLEGGYWHLLGLQVIALGQGNFDAVLYWGGLPGAGWDRRSLWKLSGSRQGTSVLLSGATRSVVLEALAADGRRWQAVTVDSAGGRLGVLPKIHRTSPTMHLPPPYGATVLFDGQPPTQLADATISPEGWLNVGFSTKAPVGDFRLHMEFQTPYEPERRGQGRGNSGVYIQRRYEVQILDSFGLAGQANECAGLYKQRRPDVNMCLPPRAWQTYDIWFRAARWNAAGEKVANAQITVLHNGEPVHHRVEIVAKTGNGQPEGPQKLPILWQNHRNPVYFRNLWIAPLAQGAASGAPRPRRCRFTARGPHHHVDGTPAYVQPG